MTNNFHDYSDGGLKGLHDSARDAYANDRKLTNEQKNWAEQVGGEPSYYGTDKHPDWRPHVDALEAAMTARGMPFTPII